MLPDVEADGDFMMCSMFNCYCLDSLILLNISLESNLYIALLIDYLHPLIDSIYFNISGLIHHAIRSKSPRIGDVQWMVKPPYSSNINPNDHLWDAVEKCICMQDPVTTNGSELWTVLKIEWFDNSAVFFWSLVESITHQFDGLEMFLHYIRKLSNDFWQVSVCSFKGKTAFSLTLFSWSHFDCLKKSLKLNHF